MNATDTKQPIHPLCLKLRELRRAANLSLTQFEKLTGIPAVVVGAYERGDRVPPLPKLEQILAHYRYRIDVVSVDASAVRPTTDVVSELRAIADQLETSNAVPTLS